MAVYNQTPKSIITDITATLQDNHGSTFEDIVLGPYQINELDFPCAHVIPDTTLYQGRSEYQTNIDVNFYFERDSKDYSFLSNLDDVDATKNDIMTKLDANTNISTYKITDEEYFVGEVGQKLLNVITFSVQSSWLVDFANV